MSEGVSLLAMCVEMVSKDLASYNVSELASLPSHLAEAVVKRVLGRQHPPPLLHELIIFCEAFWRPSSLSLHNRLPPLSSQSLLYLYYVPSLTKLDLSGNAWLDSLAFLPHLTQLQCLNLRDCWRLPEQTLALIGGLPKLNCLDMQNVYSLTDAAASDFLPGITSLQALNLSGTGISDHFLEALTYGQRLKSWKDKENLIYSGNSSNTGSLEQGRDLRLAHLLQQWRPLELVYLRLQHTKITEASLPYLASNETLVFLDVRDTEISGRSLKSFQAKHKLVSLPNNPKMLARWNSLIVAAFRGSCGCASLGAGASPAPEAHREEATDRTTQWQQDGIIQLLEAASRQRPSLFSALSDSLTRSL